MTQLSGFARAACGCRLAAVSFAEFVDPTCGIDNFLLAGVERVARRANIEMELLFGMRRAGLKRITATASHRDVVVVGMYVGFHGSSKLGWRRAGNSRAEGFYLQAEPLAGIAPKLDPEATVTSPAQEINHIQTSAEPERDQQQDANRDRQKVLFDD